MQVFDLHCDTLKRSLDTGIPLEKNDFHISFERASCFENWIQCMAIFIPDEMRGNEAFSFFIQASKHLSSEIKKSNQNINLINNFNNIDIKKNNIVFTVEGGAALAGKLENVKLLSEHGVRAMTLTWNGENEIGSGVCVENPRGITSFGCDVIHEMEKYGIAVDVSHASEKLFYDVADIAKRPFIATHSNSRAICPHKRNLTDEQFEIISKSGGIVGLVFARDFLTDNVEAKMKDIIRHAEHFLSIGGENSICLGSDFDGTDIPKDMTGIESLETLYELFLRENYNESLLNKIFFENALNFYQNFDKSLNLG